MSILRWLQSFLSGKKSRSQEAIDSDNPPAQYWPEVQDFLQALKSLIEQKTPDDPQVQLINGQVLDYLVQQIKVKGARGSQKDKAEQMEMIADRVLTTTLNKISGLSPQKTTATEFSDLVSQFKIQLQKRKEVESLKSPSLHL